MALVVYSNENCVQCTQTKKYFENNHVDFEAKMIADSPEVLALIEEKGYRAAPVVVDGDISWSGFNPEQLRAAVERVRHAEEPKP